MSSLPAALLDELLSELSTLASVYHKPPATFVGAGRYGADAIQNAAIQEQRQNAVDNPIAAAAAAQNGSNNNAENLLDIDFDGAAPASADGPPTGGASGLEGLAGTPQRVVSPAAGAPPVASSMDDMMGLFDSHGGMGESSSGGGMQNDLMNGFAGLDLSGSQPPPPQQQLHGGDSSKKTNEDLLGMF
jgi:AP-1 complex subunit beta-1